MTEVKGNLNINIKAECFDKYGNLKWTEDVNLNNRLKQSKLDKYNEE